MIRDIQTEKKEIDYSQRSARAFHTGKLCEELLQKFIPEFHPLDEGIDGELFGAPAEIKGCLMNVSRSDRVSPRSGRFYIRDYQHSELLKNDGRYIFMVIDGEQIMHTKIILASRLLPEFTGNKTLTWKTLFNQIAEAC